MMGTGKAGGLDDLYPQSEEAVALGAGVLSGLQADAESTPLAGSNHR